MTDDDDIKQIGERVAEVLTASPTGIISMQQMAETIQSRWDGTVQTNRNRIRRAIEKGGQDLIELTTRASNWDVMLPDGGHGVRAWISHQYDQDAEATVCRIVFDREQVASGYGSGRQSWLTTRATAAAAVKARREALAARQVQERDARREETRARWEEAQRRDPAYVALLQALRQAVPGLEIRVVLSRHLPEFYVMFEIEPEKAEAFKALLRRALEGGAPHQEGVLAPAAAPGQPT